MKVSRPILLGVALLVGQISASAAEVAVLRNGASISFLRKEEIGSVTRLYISGGYMDVNTAEITSFEQDDNPLFPAPTEATPGSAQSTHPTAAVQPALAAAPVDIDEVVRDASSRYQLDPDFVSSVIKAESNFKPHAVSPKGARGLMQLMPSTAAQLGVKDPFDPRANVDAGTAHLSALLDQYHNDAVKALAAYNAGSHRVQQYHGVPPYRETRAYVSKIVRDFNAKKLAQKKAARAAAKNAKKKNTAPASQSASVTKPQKPA
ncbi:MAG TPA: lytic transglycosylase domain-containing protein [Terriglobales bacterium]|nr:lytic transglycosylase domain-containing protein [Terriglobales bacterium]